MAKIGFITFSLTILFNLCYLSVSLNGLPTHLLSKCVTHNPLLCSHNTWVCFLCASGSLYFLASLLAEALVCFFFLSCTNPHVICVLSFFSSLFTFYCTDLCEAQT